MPNVVQRVNKQLGVLQSLRECTTAQPACAGWCSENKKMREVKEKNGTNKTKEC